MAKIIGFFVSIERPIEASPTGKMYPTVEDEVFLFVVNEAEAGTLLLGFVVL